MEAFPGDLDDDHTVREQGDIQMSGFGMLKVWETFLSFGFRAGRDVVYGRRGGQLHLPRSSLPTIAYASLEDAVLPLKRCRFHVEGGVIPLEARTSRNPLVISTVFHGEETLMFVAYRNASR